MSSVPKQFAFKSILVNIFLFTGACEPGDDSSESGDEDEKPTSADEGASALLPGPCSVSINSDADGRAEMTARYDYDRAGRIVSERLDIGSDGVDDSVLEREWALGGQVSAERLDDDADGVFDFEQRWYYDLMGHLVGEWVDDDADGTIDLMRIYVNDLSGRPVSLMETDGEGNWLGTTKLTYDFFGNLILYQWSDSNHPLGEMIGAWHYEYDWQGRKVRTVWDGGVNTRGVDGRLDGEIHYEYGVGQLVVREEQIEYGVRHERWSRAYNEQGLLVLERFDDVLGFRASFQTEWSYDGDGVLIGELYDADGDGLEESRTLWTYDLFGNPTSKVFDADADGQPDTIETYDYSCFKP